MRQGRLAIALSAVMVVSGCGSQGSDRDSGLPVEPPVAHIVPSAPLDAFPGYADVPHFSVSAVRGEGPYVHAPHAGTVRVGIEDDGPRQAGCPALISLALRWECMLFGRGGNVRVLAGDDGAGLRVALSPGLSVAALTRTRGRLDGEGQGAFSFAAGSSLLAVHAERRFALDDAGRWSLRGSASLALDLPRGLGTRSDSMFDAGPTLISSWRLGLEHDEDGRRHRLTVEQPARVEAGTGHLRFPSGRRVDGGRTLEHEAFSLRPTSRTVTTRWSHRRPLGSGEGVLSLFHSRHPGHARSPNDIGAGVAWRVVW